jgi:cytochrome c
MTFPGIKDARERAELLAFLKQASKPGSSQQSASGGMMAGRGQGQMGGMMGMMGGGQLPSLKKLGPDSRVQEVPITRTDADLRCADGLFIG